MKHAVHGLGVFLILNGFLVILLALLNFPWRMQSPSSLAEMADAPPPASQVFIPVR